MLRSAAGLALVFGFSNLAVASSPVFVADGDCAALDAAIASAGSTRETTIMLAHRGTYAQCGIDVQHGRVRIEGAGATLGASRPCSSPVVDVAAGATLTLRNTTLAATACTVANEGDTEFEAVTILDNNELRNAAGATLTLRNVTIDSGLVVDDGTLTLFNSTMYRVGFLGGGSFSLANSILTAQTLIHGAFPCPVGSSVLSVHSLGGNSVGSCGWAGPTDHRSLHGGAGLDLPADNGGLVPTARLASTSADAVGVGIPKYCEAMDARGRQRPAGACDAGAYELDGGAEPVQAGGINGTFYDAGADGHYVTIQRLDDDNVFIVWNTFDHNGAPAWIFGVGTYANRHLHADMLQNLGGRLQAGGPATGAVARAWGTIDINVTSCDGGRLLYASPIAEFGSGQFPLGRVAFVSDLGCAD